MENQRDTTGKLLERNAELYPQCPAVVSGEKRITYAELNAEANRLARGFLALKIGKGDRVALLMDNRPEWLSMAFAVGKIGAILVPINIRYRSHELNYILNHCSPKILVMIDSFFNADFVEIMYGLCPELKNSEKDKLSLKKFPSIKQIFCFSEEEFPGLSNYAELTGRAEEVNQENVTAAESQVSPHDSAYILYTSGTTSFPKGVVLTHANVCKNGKNVAIRMQASSNDRCWVPIPLFFSFGCANALMTVFAAGACMVLQGVFDPAEALKLIEREKCTVMYAMPTMYLPMIEHPDLEVVDISSLRTGCIIGSTDNIRSVIKKMGVSKINNGYGMTETSAVCCMTNVNDSEDVRINSIGKPFPGGSIVIKDPDTSKRVESGQEGEICVKGYNVTSKYYNDPEKTLAAFDDEGFLKTGDIGLIDINGCLRFRGRYKDMLKTSGINVSTLEVEVFLETHPDVKEAQIVGIPDKVKQEIGVGFVRLSQGSRCSAEDIIDHCKGSIASYKIPKYIRFISEFPLTGSGKVKKYLLREEAMKDLGITKE